MPITINGSGTITGASTLATAVVSPTLTTPIVTTTMGVGNATPAASGAGITFPATQSASSDANTLDDYEEGTFTPTLVQGFSTAPTSYTTQNGSYVKIGKFVYFQLDIAPVGAVANGTHVRFGGLPFTSENTSAKGFGGAFVNYQASYNTNAGDIYHITLNTTSIGIYINNGNNRLGNEAGVNINARIILCGTYQTST